MDNDVADVADFPTRNAIQCSAGTVKWVVRIASPEGPPRRKRWRSAREFAMEKHTPDGELPCS
jgi:hypothetical protein